MPRLPSLSRDARVNTLIGAGHFLSHFYVLCLPPLFLAWQSDFGVSFAELGLTVTLTAAASAVLQTPMGFLVDRYGAKPFLIGGTLMMALPLAAMSLATDFWQILALALLSGIGNSVFHPADYAILAGSVNRDKMGRAFAFHTFTGNLGFATAPTASAGLLALFGWRGTVLALGLLAVPVVCIILWQSPILHDQGHVRAPKPAGATAAGIRALMARPILLFFGFFLLSSMAGSGLQAWLITVLHETRGFVLEAASAALTGYVVGGAAGTLVGGWVADRTTHHLGFTVVLTVIASALVLLVAVQPMAPPLTAAVLFIAGLLTGSSRTPRDVMVKDAAPPGEVGKIFGFVSAGLPLGQALTPAPFGALIDMGRPDLVLVLSAALLLASLFFVGSARATSKRVPVVAAAD
jgi:MFS transporter, FSR family, fosmidomycin resistance protein